MILPGNMPVSDLARIVGGWLGHQSGQTRFLDQEGHVLDSSKTFFDLGLGNLSAIQYVDSLPSVPD